jgi:hypothetical protein
MNKKTGTLLLGVLFLLPLAASAQSFTPVANKNYTAIINSWNIADYDIWPDLKADYTGSMIVFSGENTTISFSFSDGTRGHYRFSDSGQVVFEDDQIESKHGDRGTVTRNGNSFALQFYNERNQLVIIRGLINGEAGK